MSLLDVINFSFRYSGSENYAVREFNMTVNDGEIVVLAGPSGCGKSTLLRSINGLIPHMYGGDYLGDVVVSGMSVKETEMRKLAQHVGFLFQNPENQIFMFSVERDIAFGLENLGIERREIVRRVSESMRMLNISHLASRAPHELSDGQKQRVALAGIIAMRPRLVILDEPTSLLDPVTALELIHLVREIRDETNSSFIIVEHRLDLVLTIADRLVVMYDGKKVFDDKPENILLEKNPELYGVLTPSITRLQREMINDGIPLPRRLLSAEELADELLRE